jgi:hypothetical protein
MLRSSPQYKTTGRHIQITYTIEARRRKINPAALLLILGFLGRRIDFWTIFLLNYDFIR